MQDQLVFSPDALLRFRRGRMLIHTTSSRHPALETDSAALIGWLSQFSNPTNPQTLISALSPTDQTLARSAVEHLRRNGSLVEAETAHLGSDTAGAFSRTKNHLRALARSIYDISCDIIAVGPAAESSAEGVNSVGVESRLLALLAAVDNLRAVVDATRLAQTKRHLQDIEAHGGQRNLKLHLGCGPAHLRDWVNVDVYPAPFPLNVLAGFPFNSSSVKWVFASHILEHLFFPRDVDRLFSELRRIMQPGAVIRVVVPDVQKCIRAYVDRDQTFFASRRETWPWWPSDPTPLEDFLAYAGAGPEPAYLFESHKYGYDFETIQKVLSKAGFVNIERSEFMQSSHPTLLVDDASSVAKARYGDKYYSLFVEAEAPSIPT